MMHQPICNDIHSSKKLLKEGFIKLDFFSETELNDIKSALDLIQIDNPPDSPDYHVTLLSTDKEYKRKVHELLTPVIKKKAAAILKGYNVLLTNLIIKNPGSGEVPLHQNWTFVDESQFRSYTLWIPLTDTDETNGTLEFIAGSHDLFADVKRGHNTPYFFMKEMDELKKYLIPVPLKAGETMLFDDAILHYSKPNISDKFRIAIQVTLVPENAPLFHYHFQKGFFYDKVYQLPVNAGFYEALNFQPKTRTVFKRFIKRKITDKEWQKMAFFHKLHSQVN